MTGRTAQRPTRPGGPGRPLHPDGGAPRAGRSRPVPRARETFAAPSMPEHDGGGIA